MAASRSRFSRRAICSSASIKHPKRQFSIKVGTIFEDSPIGLDKWLPALWMIANDKNGISSYELHRALGVTQKTAWFMLHRIRLAMQNESFEKLSGTVEIDETFIGGAARFMHKDKRAEKITGTGTVGKTAVLGCWSDMARTVIVACARGPSRIVGVPRWCRLSRHMSRLAQKS